MSWLPGPVWIGYKQHEEKISQAIENDIIVGDKLIKKLADIKC